MNSQSPTAPQPGEFRFATAEGTKRLVLLLSIDEKRQYARAVLVSTEPELATDHSLLFAGAEIGAHFSALVQADLVMPIWLKQLGPRVGQLPIPLGPVVAAAEHNRFAPELAARRGLPLAGPHDSRVKPRDQEVDELWLIAGDCVAALEGWDR